MVHACESWGEGVGFFRVEIELDCRFNVAERTIALARLHLYSIRVATECEGSVRFERLCW